MTGVLALGMVVTATQEGAAAEPTPADGAGTAAAAQPEPGQAPARVRESRAERRERAGRRAPALEPGRAGAARPAARGPGADDARPEGSAAGNGARNFGPVRRLQHELSPSASGAIETPAAVDKFDSEIAPVQTPPIETPERHVPIPRRAAPRAAGAAAAAAPPAATGDNGRPPTARAERTLTLDDAQLNQVRACRAEVAAEPRREGKEVLAGKLDLRWTILADGTVQNPEVVALTDTDPAVMACVQRRMAGWRFARPAGAPPVQLSRTLAF